ncbi:MAG TPA: DEAD/DEAH box helicase family protein, partial [Synergistaceae bacterium]|nr:DEAD/DEAH box helicase family protein [Synergistaceae bacterium]
LVRLVLRRRQRCPLAVEEVREHIVDRHYQKRALLSVFQHFSQARRKALLVMATGTGKTRTAIALVDVLQRAGWVKRTLFLADRVALVKQAVSAFKKHLPDSTTVNLITEKNAPGQIFVCTYPTMMGLLEECPGDMPRFGVGYFDLVIIDEAHRSVYQKYGAIFRYFDSLLVGLTATPREELDKNTYDLFDLETGVPTDAYELESAVRDGYLVPYEVTSVDMKFPKEGIHYDELSPEEQARWESLDWGDEELRSLPEHVNPNALNSWLFNEDTVDKVLQCLLERGHKVEGGDRLAKTIIFARNHKHAVFIEERFNYHYPHYAGHFARVIDNYASYAQSLIDDFSRKEKAPHLAVSVDMLDTGIDVPEVANLVFFKPVYSRIKFWQMIGRGTRLCPDLFGPGEDKRNFYIFDFCGNFDFFREHPRGMESSAAPSLNTRLFSHRVRLLGGLQDLPREDPQGALRAALGDILHSRVSSMPLQNFQVRPYRREVERFRNREAWNSLGVEDRHILVTELASLPSSEKEEDERLRRFDLKALSMQIGLLEGDGSRFEMYRRQVVALAALLEEKKRVPPVAAQLDYLARIQENEFWECISLEVLEDMRLRLRGLTVFLDKTSRSVVYTDFEDRILEIRQESPAMPRMTGEQYAKKVEAYLANHRDDLVIHKLHTNEPLTSKDLENLEETLVRIGEAEGKALLSGLLARSGAPSLVHFVRSLVGLDREAAQRAFSSFLSDYSLSTSQIRFVELIVDQLTARGIMESSALYEPPFSDLHAGGPEELFAGREGVMEDLFSTLSTTVPRVLGQVG